MLKKCLTILLLLIIVQTVSAQIVKVEIDPQTLLPNDVAECKLTFTAQENTYISGITIHSPSEVQVIPSSISGIGWLSAGSSYEFPFTIKAKESGIYTLTVYINTLNGTIKQSITIRVLDQMPDIILDKTVLTLNEVNTVQFTVTSPLNIQNVVVQPLFEADPQIIFVQDGKGSFKFEPTKPQPLKFKISFYNGRNYHEVVRTVDVSYVESRGVLLNVTSKYPVALIGDVIPIEVDVTNLRCDDIYSINVASNFSKKQFQIPSLKPGETANIEFDFCSKTHGIKDVQITVTYKDEFNNIHRKLRSVEIKVLNETTLQFSGIDVKVDTTGLTVTGDVCNNGRSKAYNVYVVAESNGIVKTYYIDSLEPSDFDTFEFTFANYSNPIVLKVKWNNELGYSFEIEKVVEVPNQKFVEKGTDNTGIIVSFTVLAFVVILILLAWKRRR